MEQKRKYKRFYFNGDVALKTDNGSTRLLRGYINDIGLGGFRIHSREHLELNKDVGISVATQLLERPLLGRGRVKHVMPVRIYDRDLYSVGIQFTHINKDTIKALINKTFGWTKKPFISRQLRREISFVLKLLPIIIPLVWFGIRVSEDLSITRAKELQYREEFRKALVYFLYHS